jgi:glycosyltransferase domain-containing protein
MTLSSRQRYALLVPTYNRPACLRSLLGYLAARGFEYPIRVLDSSSSEGLSKNRDTIGAAGLDIVHQIYDPTMPVATKFADGARSVDTPYCSFCADDDILFTDHLARCLDFLDVNPCFAAAHGYYVNFKPAGEFEISETVYAAPSIGGDDSIKRIVQQMSNYQAIFYAVYRTSVMQSVLLQLERMQSLLAQELLSSSLALIAGGVCRLPHFYMGRNTNPSIASEGWHPHQILADKPELLLREYAAYRAVVLEQLLADARSRLRYHPDQMERIIDVAHLRYLAPMLSPPIMDYIISESMVPGRQPRDIARGVWQTFATPPKRVAWHWTVLCLHYLKAALLHPRAAKDLIADARRLNRLARLLRRREQLAASLAFGLDQLRVVRTTRDGRSRQYLLSRQFLDPELPHGGRVSAGEIASMLRQLDDYV